MTTRLKFVCVATMVNLMVLMMSSPSSPAYATVANNASVSFCRVAQHQGSDLEFRNTIIILREPEIPREPPVPSEPQMPRIPEVQKVIQRIY